MKECERLALKQTAGKHGTARCSLHGRRALRQPCVKKLRRTDDKHRPPAVPVPPAHLLLARAEPVYIY